MEDIPAKHAKGGENFTADDADGNGWGEGGEKEETERRRNGGMGKRLSVFGIAIVLVLVLERGTAREAREKGAKKKGEVSQRMKGQQRMRKGGRGIGKGGKRRRGERGGVAADEFLWFPPSGITTRRRGALPRQARVTIKVVEGFHPQGKLCRELRRQLCREPRPFTWSSFG